MAESDRLYFRADAELQERVARFERRHGFEDRSKATRRLVEIGLRESKAPLLYRLKDLGIEAAFTLGIVAFAIVGVGATTDVVAAADAYMAGVVLFMMAAGLLAIVELLRALNGQSEVGEFVRGVRQ